ncbi:MAG: DNA gyrase/topoisomerase IV subunit A [Hyphomicrobiales bacterium]
MEETEEKGLNTPEESAQINNEENEKEYQPVYLSGLYKNWFLDYASYVILERAVPNVLDGLKPVQRRILHTMKVMDDGRYNKVANVIGHTMQYHPHGDASIGDALVQLGQKDLLVDTQGNWGNILTGDSAAAPRYIEARLSKFALDVVFNPKTTDWKLSYDGRNKEPDTLPVKFPLLLVQGVEGIAVGLASKILPHNFNEVIDASVSYLKDEDFDLYPDFLTGGAVDVGRYNDGIRGGKVKIRAKIDKLDKKTLVVNEIPFGTTTTSVIESILSANEKSKIKIKKIDDNTAENVEIVIHLASGVSPDQTIDALFAFTQCEISISPNSCVIDEDRPAFLGVNEILRRSVDSAVNLLTKELEIKLSELQEQWHFSSLEKIFIEKKIYRKIEVAESWEEVISIIDKALTTYRKLFTRDITQDDIVRLTEIKIKRISKYNNFKADEYIKSIEDEMDNVKDKLSHIIEYTIEYFQRIQKKYGHLYPRKTEIRNFDNIQANLVAVANQKLYIDKEEGFAGTALKKAEFVCECSDIDDIIIFKGDGSYVITKVTPKFFVGKDVIYIDVHKKNDTRTIYNMIYRDGRGGISYAKRFNISAIKKDAEYNITRGTNNSRILYFSVNPNGEAEIVKLFFRPKPYQRKTSVEYDFSKLEIRNRSSRGNKVTSHSVRLVVKKEDGVSTLGAIKIWFDDTVKRINTETRGRFIGDFVGGDKILVLTDDGKFELYNYDVANHFPENMTHIMKFDSSMVFNVVFFEGALQKHYIKRFSIPNDFVLNKRTSFLTDDSKSYLEKLSFNPQASVTVEFDGAVNSRQIPTEDIIFSDFIAVKSYTARGKRISNYVIKQFTLQEPEIFIEEETVETETEVNPQDVTEEDPKKKVIEPEEDHDGQLFIDVE